MSSDNIEAPTVEAQPETTVEAVVEPAQSTQPTKPALPGPNAMLSAREAVDVIQRHFERELPMQARFPPQLFDGCAVEFYDAKLSSIVYATGRLRFRNACSFDGTTGDFKVLVCVSDLVMKA